MVTRSQTGMTSWLMALCVVTPSAAWAGKPKILVLPYQHLSKDLPEDLGTEATSVIVREMGAQDLLAVRVDDIRMKSGKVQWDGAANFAPRGDPKAQIKVEAYLSKAAKSMDDGEVGQAIDVLETAIQFAEKNAETLTNLQLLSELYFQLGVAYFRDGSEEEGDDMLQRAVHFDPERAIDHARYPPLFVKVFDRSRYNVLRRKRLQVDVLAPQGARLLLDGRDVGEAPLRLSEVLPGKHWLKVRTASGPTMVKAIRVQADTVVEFPGAEESGKLATTVSTVVRKNRVGLSALESMKVAGRKARAEVVMFGGIFKTNTAYQIRSVFVSVADGSVVRLVDVAFDLDMLSAEVEVFKLVKDAQTQARASEFERRVDMIPFFLAPEFEQRKGHPRLNRVVATPPPIAPPKSLYARQGPVRKPAATKRPELLPKDEQAAVRSPSKSLPMRAERNPSKSPPPPMLIGPVPKDEQAARARQVPSLATSNPAVKEDSESNWWIWALVGVAAAGAAAAGGVLIANEAGGDPQGNVTVTWGGR